MYGYSSAKKIIKYIIPLLLILIISIIVSASVGSANLSLKETAVIIASYIPGLSYFVNDADINPQSAKIIAQIRIPRILLAVFVGIALASAGVIFQGILFIRTRFWILRV